MKYVKQLKAKLYFQRGIPLRLRSVAGKANFSRPLGLDAATAGEQQILEARIEAQRMYDLYLKTLENTSADAYADNEIEALAADVPRRSKATAGQYAPHMLGPKLQENDPDLAELPQVLTGQDYATLAVPEYLNQYLQWHQDGELDDEGKLTRSLTAQEEAVICAWEAVQKVAVKKPRTLYISSIQRDTNEFIACFNWINQEYRLNWRPVKSKLSASKKTQNKETKQKLTLARDEQSQLLTNGLEANTPLAAALLVLFQAGGMATEIARLRVEEDLWLNHEFPFVAFLGGWNRDTKNEERPRYIPIVFGLELIRDKLPEAIELLAKQSEPSQTLTQELQKMLLPASKQRHFTSHCLRHTFRLNAQNVLANSMATMAIAGWSGEKTNKIAMQYGAEGFSHSESLRALHQEQRKIFAHLIKQEQQYKGDNSNVLPFSGDKSQ